MTDFSCPESCGLASVLQHRFVTVIRHSEASAFPFPVADLLDRRRLQAFIALQSKELETSDASVVGTLFAKRYSVFVMGLAAAFSLFDTPLAMSHDKVRFEIVSGGAMRYETALDRRFPSGWAAKAERRRLELADYIRRMQEHVQPVFESVSALTGAAMNVMWALVAHNVQQMYARLEVDRQILKSEQRLERIKEDRVALLEQGGERMFSVKLQRFEHPLGDSRPLLIRRYCCLAYRTGHDQQKHGYCGTCPKLSASERLRLLADQA